MTTAASEGGGVTIREMAPPDVAARSAKAARALVASAAGSVPGQDLMLDVSMNAPEWPAALRDMGLREQRPFTRMYRAGAAPPGRPELTFAAFGPELG